MPTRIRATVATAAVCACTVGPAVATPTTTQTTTTGTQTTTMGTQTTPTGTQTTTAPPTAQRDVCLASGRRVIARSLGVGSAAISIRFWQGSNGMPQCSYRIRRPRTGGPHDRVIVTVNVDSAPQAAWRLMRKVVEATQLFGPAPPGWHAPVGLFGLGPNASWFIDLHALMAVNHTRTELLTATIGWRRAKQPEMIRLARAVILAYIHAPAKAYPVTVSAY